MATRIGNFTVVSTGTKAITNLTFMPTHIDFYLAQKPSTSEAFTHYSTGSANGMTQMAHSVFQDSSGGRTQSYFDRCINHKSRIGGVIQDAITGTFTSFDDNGSGVFGFTIEITSLADSPQKIYFVARD